MGRRKNTAQEQDISQNIRRLQRAEDQRRRRHVARQNIVDNNRAVQEPAVEPDYLGLMNILCQHCKAKHFKDEKVSNKGLSFNDCCHHGSVKHRIHYQIFRQNFQIYLKKNMRNHQVFLNVSMNTALYLSNGDLPSYGQLFIIDQHEALNYRIQQNPTIDYELMSILDSIIRNNNIYAKSYEMMKEEIRLQQMITNIRNDSSPSELQLLFSLKPGQDSRRYNIQRVNEVAAIFSTTADGEIPESYVTIRNKNKIIRIYYTRYRIADRANEFNPIIRGRRLFQQYVVDSYVKIEKDRIQYCKHHQKELRADTYKGLQDHMRNCANDVNGHVGKTIILPSSFTGSPRYMQQCYQDAMAIVNETGSPDIFLTMTCNPNWPEITDNLLPGQQACDRPDLVARVFDLKKDRLLDIVIKKSFFGKVASFVYVIEFQKRGLPHIHLSITLEQGYKIIRPDIVDKFISAEIPIQIRNPRLFDIVMRNMIHGPCGDWCMKDGKCSKNFPKSFQQETTMDANGYSNYRRTDDGVQYERSNGHTVDNRWVVPHCRELLLLFDCHINVEIVSSIKAVKYLYKYIYKGHDAATVVIGQAENGPTIEHDECHNFIETRYVGPVEACYRIFSKKMQDKSHTVT
ncbi:uncharacterized protein LOC131675045 [Phymastichus coffea]|uniref:uncharacterized protein LOC131675045 n=1 Tax=Phymastichus coffea TaxID=108790 RepID=UPI00273CE0B5|nr:uncharacterized protein LOC131675045 [Phymastichus coffea]